MRSAFLLAVSFAVFQVSLFGQLATTTALVGTVTDASGQTVPGAKITAVNQGTSDTYSATTNEQGYYSIQFVRAGAYTLTVEHAGFQKVEKTGIVLDNNQIVRNDASLSVGSLSQSVTIQAEAPVIKQDDASVAETITTRQVAELPLNGRDPMRLAITTPGVIPGLKADERRASGRGFYRRRYARNPE